MDKEGDMKELKLKYENQIYESDARKAIYYSIIKCPDGIVRLYSNRWVKHFNTICTDSRDGVTFDQSKTVVLKASGATHNFTPFYGKNRTLYSIGGVDNWKHDRAFHGITSYDVFKKVYEEKFQWPCTREVFDLSEHKRLLSNKKMLEHVRGLYLFKSETGLHWEQIGKKPIVTTKNEGFIDAIKNFGKGSEFDGQVCCVYDENTDQYFLYVRANVAVGFRYIQYSTSKDLIHWDKFRLININGYQADRDNYYTPSIFRYKKIFVGLIPYFDIDGNCCIRLVRGVDGVNFDIVGRYFHEQIVHFKDGKPKNTCHSVYGILPRKGVINIYIHHNNLGLDNNSPVTVVRYTVPEEKFDEVISCL
jgi:hypothetical protein